MLVADAVSVRMCLLWAKVVRSVVVDSELAFPDYSGSPHTHLVRKMQEATSGLGHSLPSSTSFRKAIEIRNKRLEGPLRSAVSRSLSHSLATAEQYYQSPSLTDVYSTYHVLNDIISGRRASKLSLTPNRPVDDERPLGGHGVSKKRHNSPSPPSCGKSTSFEGKRPLGVHGAAKKGHRSPSPHSSEDTSLKGKRPLGGHGAAKKGHRCPSPRSFEDTSLKEKRPLGGRGAAKKGHRSPSSSFEEKRPLGLHGAAKKGHRSPSPCSSKDTSLKGKRPLGESGAAKKGHRSPSPLSSGEDTVLKGRGKTAVGVHGVAKKGHRSPSPRSFEDTSLKGKRLQFLIL